MGICVVLAAMTVFQAFFVVLFATLFYRRRALPPREDLPKTGILLPLRGADAKLSDGLKRLIQQDYPDYEVQIVIDSVEDPAWPVVQQVGRRNQRQARESIRDSKS